MTFELLENAIVENTYGIFRSLNIARFRAYQLAGLVIYRRDNKGFGIDTLDAIRNREDRHDGTICA